MAFKKQLINLTLFKYLTNVIISVHSSISKSYFRNNKFNREIQNISYFYGIY